MIIDTIEQATIVRLPCPVYASVYIDHFACLFLYCILNLAWSAKAGISLYMCCSSLLIFFAESFWLLMLRLTIDLVCMLSREQKSPISSFVFFSQMIFFHAAKTAYNYKVGVDTYCADIKSNIAWFEAFSNSTCSSKYDRCESLDMHHNCASGLSQHTAVFESLEPPKGP